MTTFQILQLEPGQAQPVAVSPLYQDAQFPVGSIHSTLTSFPRQLQAWLEWREVQRAHRRDPFITDQYSLWRPRTVSPEGSW